MSVTYPTATNKTEIIYIFP